ncbi:hypothetical protein FALBO_10909 [Fusarium albosuccineum]|uniref:Uncharacterized protein n=1 Tax=Fusarium albosuccineum TaxID=1237068 RepID=A0A8H4L3J1_9HYPO|nr:hypothetical protein FALBO_10909 [Fusarium albosuccineum]
MLTRVPLSYGPIKQPLQESYTETGCENNKPQQETPKDASNATTGDILIKKTNPGGSENNQPLQTELYKIEITGPFLLFGSTSKKNRVNRARKGFTQAGTEEAVPVVVDHVVEF